MFLAHNTCRLSLNMGWTQLNSTFSQVGCILAQGQWELSSRAVDDMRPSHSFGCHTMAQWAILLLLPSLGHTSRNSRFRIWVIHGTSRGATQRGWCEEDQDPGWDERAVESAHHWLKMKKLRAVLHPNTTSRQSTSTMPMTFASLIIKIILQMINCP